MVCLRSSVSCKLKGRGSSIRVGGSCKNGWVQVWGCSWLRILRGRLWCRFEYHLEPLGGGQEHCWPDAPLLNQPGLRTRPAPVAFPGADDDGEEDLEAEFWIAEQLAVGAQVFAARSEVSAWVGVPLADPVRAGALVSGVCEPLCVSGVSLEEVWSSFGVGPCVAGVHHQGRAKFVLVIAKQDSAGLASL